MYVLYCLQNEALKNNILSFGIIASLEKLKKLVKDINKTFIPMPYTIFVSKNVNNPNCIENLYSLLAKFGKHIKDTFFEIDIEIVKYLFELVKDNNYINNNDNDKYIIIQNNIEYIIPKLDYKEVIYAIPNKPIKSSFQSISSIIDDIDNCYDKLIPRTNNDNDYGDLDL